MKKRCTTHRGSSRRGLWSPKSLSGFTLIELMIAMLLGLVVIGGVISVFLANQQVYRTNEALGDVQDGSRNAFELMAQDIRNSGLTGCDSSSTGNVVTVLKNSPGGGGTTWWANWNNALRGYDGTVDPALTVGAAVNNQAAGTPSLELIGATDTGLSVLSHSTATTLFTLNETSSDLLTGDAMIVCDPQFAAIFQSTSYSAGAKTVGYNTLTSKPGNFSNILATTGIPYTFGANALITKLTAVDWYIGNSPAVVPPVVGGRSLFRMRLVNDGTGNLVTNPEEMVRNVIAMKIAYLQSGNSSFQPASAITNWPAVTAVQVQLTLQSTDQHAGTDVKPLTRFLTATTTARNRVN
jgi:type IV pilus assembly protein PilW